MDAHRITAEPGYVIRGDRAKGGVFYTGWLPLHLGPVPRAESYELEVCKAVCQAHYDRVLSSNKVYSPQQA